ncbi:MAG: glycosyltransferase family 2 protein [Gallionella sp.]|nr:glycosyltransferase family 2 protein [Gallionella sp.]
MPKKISLVIPAHNEGEAIYANLATILAAVPEAGADLAFEAIVIDDGSTDDTAAEVLRFSAHDPRVSLVAFTRNFGKEASILAGLDHAGGEAVIVMDADLQHPPALIAQMVALWRQGFAVVEAVKQDRGAESAGSRLFAWLFYALFRRSSGFDLATRSDFKLLDRSVVEAYRALPENRRFFRGLIAWLGHPLAQIPFSVPPRQGGKSRWGTFKLLRYAIDNLTAFSAIPLHIVSWLGAAMLLLGMVIGTASLVQKWRGEALDGFTTVILLIVIASGVLMVSLGVIGHYLACIYDELKHRPAYILKPQRRDEPCREEP